MTSKRSCDTNHKDNLARRAAAGRILMRRHVRQAEGVTAPGAQKWPQIQPGRQATTARADSLHVSCHQMLHTRETAAGGRGLQSPGRTGADGAWLPALAGAPDARHTAASPLVPGAAPHLFPPDNTHARSLPEPEARALDCTATLALCAMHSCLQSHAGHKRLSGCALSYS